tara:strand:+ start:4347 stop:4766 length:420 start_codon:yes stop_codon:yes gene_type:complete
MDFTCLNPVYTLNKEQQNTCSSKRALFYSIIVFTIVLIISYLIVSFRRNEKYDEEKREYDNNKAISEPKKPTFLSNIIRAVIFPLIVSIIVYFLNKKIFEITIIQNDSIIKNMVDRGISYEKAHKELSRLRQIESVRRR